MKCLLVKMFAGKFNNDNVSHEVINLYAHDEKDNDDYRYLYIPPHGFVGKKEFKEEDPFYDTKNYKDYRDVFFIKKTEFSYVYQIVSYARIEKEDLFTSIDQIQEISNSIHYNNVKLNEIEFGIEDEEDINKYSNIKISHISYRVKKNNYFDLREKNIYIYPGAGSEDAYKVANAEEIKSKFSQKYPEFIIHELSFLKTWHNYTYVDNREFNTFFENHVRCHINSNNIFDMPKLENIDANIRYNRTNVLEFIDKANDENIITNMLIKVLKSNQTLFNKFVEFAFSKTNSTIVPNNKRISENPLSKQHQAIWEKLRLCLKLKRSKNEGNITSLEENILKTYGLNKGDSKNYAEHYQKLGSGYIDLYISGNNYRMVIENKVKSGLNGVFCDTEGQTKDQLNKYRTFLNELNIDENCEKENLIIMLAPDYNCEFKHDELNGIIKYSELYYFLNQFTVASAERNNINEEYYNLLLNAIAKHSSELYEEIQQRFYITTLE